MISIGFGNVQNGTVVSWKVIHNRSTTIQKQKQQQKQKQKQKIPTYHTFNRHGRDPPFSLKYCCHCDEVNGIVFSKLQKGNNIESKTHSLKAFLGMRTTTAAAVASNPCSAGLDILVRWTLFHNTGSQWYSVEITVALSHTKCEHWSG